MLKAKYALKSWGKIKIMEDNTRKKGEEDGNKEESGSGGGEEDSGDVEDKKVTYTVTFFDFKKNVIKKITKEKDSVLDSYEMPDLNLVTNKEESKKIFFQIKTGYKRAEGWYIIEGDKETKYTDDYIVKKDVNIGLKYKRFWKSTFALRAGGRE